MSRAWPKTWLRCVHTCDGPAICHLMDNMQITNTNMAEVDWRENLPVYSLVGNSYVANTGRKMLSSKHVFEGLKLTSLKSKTIMRQRIMAWRSKSLQSQNISEQTCDGHHVAEQRSVHDSEQEVRSRMTQVQEPLPRLVNYAPPEPTANRTTTNGRGLQQTRPTRPAQRTQSSGLFPRAHIISLQIPRGPTGSSVGQDIAASHLLEPLLAEMFLSDNLQDRAFSTSRLIPSQDEIQRLVRSMPSFTWTEQDDQAFLTTQETRLQCPVSQVDINVGDAVLRLPCGHMGSADALQLALETSGRCPVCAYVVGTPLSQANARSNSVRSFMPPSLVAQQNEQSNGAGGLNNSVRSDRSSRVPDTSDNDEYNRRTRETQHTTHGQHGETNHATHEATSHGRSVETSVDTAGETDIQFNRATDVQTNTNNASAMHGEVEDERTAGISPSTHEGRGPSASQGIQAVQPATAHTEFETTGNSGTYDDSHAPPSDMLLGEVFTAENLEPRGASRCADSTDLCTSKD